jgi:hypothetical protein
MVEEGEGGGLVLSSREQRIWDDVLRFWAEEAEEPPLATPSREWSSSDEAELPIAVAAGLWITIPLILFGMMSAAVTVGFTTALGWALWHYWPRLSPRPPCGPSRPAGHGGHPTTGLSPTVPNDRVSCDRR